MKSDKIKININHSLPIIAMDANAGSTLLAVSQQGATEKDPILTLIDLKTRKEIHIIEHYDLNSIPSLAFSHTQDLLLYSKNDEQVEIFDLKKRSITDSIVTSRNRKIRCAKSSGKVVLSGTATEVWDAGNTTLLWREDKYKAFQQHGPVSTKDIKASWDPAAASRQAFISQPAAACFFDHDKKILYAGVNEPKIFVYDLQDKSLAPLLHDGPFQCNDLKLSRDEKYLCSLNQVPAGLFVWNLATKERAARQHANEKEAPSSAIDFHPTKNILAIGSATGYLTLLDIEQEKVLFSECIHDTKISQLLFVNEGRHVITASMSGELLLTEIS
ncbi:MAG: hypothetical protein INR73_03365 [Williamsia sp.]|nr:hypothetical protein [Williamsia sp.]